MSEKSKDTRSGKLTLTITLSQKLTLTITLSQKLNRLRNYHYSNGGPSTNHYNVGQS